MVTQKITDGMGMHDAFGVFLFHVSFSLAFVELRWPE